MEQVVVGDARGADDARPSDLASRPLPAGPDPHRSLGSDQDFLLLWLGRTTSGLGSQVSLLALPLTAILLLHAGALRVGMLAASETAPFLLIGLPAGVWLERVPRRPVLVATGLLRTAVLAVVPVGFALGWLSLGELVAVAFCLGLLTTLFDIAWQAYLPGLVGFERLHEANARLSVSGSGAQLAGPGLAGVLVGWLTAPVALLADAAGFALAGLFVWRIRRPELRPAGRERGGVGGQIGEGLRFVLGRADLRAIAFFTGVANAVGAALNVVLVVFEARVLHLGPGEIGLLFLLGNLGLVLGAVGVSALSNRFGLGPTLLAGAALMGVGPALLPLSHAGLGVSLIVAGWFVRAFGSPLYGTNQVSYRLAVTPERLVARMTATMKFFVMGAMPLGSFLAGLLGSTLGLRTTLWVIAALSALAVVGLWRGGFVAVAELPRGSRRSERSATVRSPRPVEHPVPV